MHCPMCQKVMRFEQIRGAGFYLCRDCRGLWVQTGELTKLAETIEPDELLQNRVPIEESAGASVDVVMVCPRCKQAMSSYEYAYDSGVMIDRCGECGAIWLDSGKIFLVKQHLQQSIPQPGEAAGLLGTPWQSGLLSSLAEDDFEAGGRVLGFVIEGLAELLLELLD